MKKFSTKILLLVVLFAIHLTNFAQINKTEIEDAFKNGNSEKLGLFLSNPVELFILTESETVSRADAVKKINSFFLNVNPNNFVILHNGGKSVYQYVIGNLRTSKGEYRIWYLLKEENSRIWITQLRVEEK